MGVSGAGGGGSLGVYSKEIQLDKQKRTTKCTTDPIDQRDFTTSQRALTNEKRLIHIRFLDSAGHLLFLTQHFALSENLVLYTSPTFTHLS